MAEAKESVSAAMSMLSTCIDMIYDDQESWDAFVAGKLKQPKANPMFQQSFKAKTPPTKDLKTTAIIINNINEAIARLIIWPLITE